MTALYRAYGLDGRLLYVGITDDLETRIKQHLLDAPWVDLLGAFTIHHYASRADARAAEIAAIRTEWPLYNVDQSPDPASAAWLLWLWSRKDPFPSAEPIQLRRGRLIRRHEVRCRRVWAALRTARLT